jgi:hypothetical protein
MEVYVLTTDISLLHPEVQLYFTRLNEISDLVLCSTAIKELEDNCCRI